MTQEKTSKRWIDPTQALRHNPFEIAAFIGALMLGLAALMAWVWPGNGDSEIPIWFNLVWGLAFVVGSTLCLLGTRKTARIDGVTLEQIGLSILAVACFMSGISLGVVSKTYEFSLVSLLLFLLGGACTVEWLRINSMIRSIYRRKKGSTRG